MSFLEEQAKQILDIGFLPVEPTSDGRSSLQLQQGFALVATQAGNLRFASFFSANPKTCWESVESSPTVGILKGSPIFSKVYLGFSLLQNLSSSWGPLTQMNMSCVDDKHW